MSCGLLIERIYGARVFFAPLGGIFGPFGGLFSVFFAIFWLSFDFGVKTLSKYVIWVINLEGLLG